MELAHLTSLTQTVPPSGQTWLFLLFVSSDGPQREAPVPSCASVVIYVIFLGLGQDLLTFAAFLREIFLHKEPSLFC